MLRKKPRMPDRAPAAHPSAGNLLHSYKHAFLEWTCVIGLSADTAAIRGRGLESFIRWCDERGIDRPQDITRPILQRYQRHLFHYRKANGQPLAFGTQASLLQAVRAFFKWLAVENHILYNPAADLEIPRQIRQLPKLMLSVEDVASILAVPDVTTLMGIRNRAMLETLYSTGIRRAELMNLKLIDADTRGGVLVVRQVPVKIQDPFLIQARCFQVVRAMDHIKRRACVLNVLLAGPVDSSGNQNQQVRRGI